jgi:hypothetical protein
MLITAAWLVPSRARRLRSISALRLQGFVCSYHLRYLPEALALRCRDPRRFALENRVRVYPVPALGRDRLAGEAFTMSNLAAGGKV